MNRFEKILSAAYIILLAVSLGLLVFGIACFISTITLYATILLLFLLFLKWFNRFSKTGYLTELKLSCISLCVCLCLADLTVRYLVKPSAYLDYREQNGSSYYTSQTFYQKFRFINKYFTPLYDFSWFHVHIPHAEIQMGKQEFSYLHKFNNEGLRNADISEKKGKNELRIESLGDSFTEGVGAPQDSTWPVLLNRLISAGGDTGKIYTVINAGSSGSDPFFEFYLLNYRLLKYNPDIVLMAINQSDIDDVISRGGFGRFRPDSTSKVKDSPWWEPIYASSVIFRMFIRSVCRYDYKLMPLSSEKDLQLDAIKKIGSVINEFAKLAKEHHFKPVIIISPLLLELQANHPSLNELKTRVEQNKDLTIIDLFEEYQRYFEQNHANPADYFWARDLHQNSKGYLLWSNLVYNRLVESKIL